MLTNSFRYIIQKLNPFSFKSIILFNILLSFALINISSVKAESNSVPSRNYTTDDYVNSVAISADGSYIVAGGYDRRVYLFQRDSSEPLWNFTADGSISSVAISLNNSNDPG